MSTQTTGTTDVKKLDALEVAHKGLKAAQEMRHLVRAIGCNAGDRLIWLQEVVDRSEKNVRDALHKARKS